VESVWAGGRPRLAAATTPTAPGVRSAPGPPHAAGLGTATPPGWAPSLCRIPGDLVISPRIWRLCGGSTLRRARRRDSPPCINAGGSSDISLTSGHGCPSRNAGPSHGEGLRIPTMPVPAVPMPGLCPPMPRSGDGSP